MSKKLILNFFGELSSINLPINLSSLKILISDLYQFSATETEEIIIYYILNNNEILISSEEDYKKFLLTNINQIYLNIAKIVKFTKQILISLMKKWHKIKKN